MGLRSMSRCSSAQWKPRFMDAMAFRRLPPDQFGCASTHVWTWNGLRSAVSKSASMVSANACSPVGIPAVGFFGAVLLAPLQVRVDKRDSRLGGDDPLGG